MTDASLNWITTIWDTDNVSGNFIWNDISGNASTTAHGNYKIKENTTDGTVTWINDASDYTDQGTTIKGKNMIFDYYNNILIGDTTSILYTLYHDNYEIGSLSLTSRDNFPSWNFVFKVSEYKEDIIEGYFSWDVPVTTPFGVDISGEITYTFTSYLSGSIPSPNGTYSDASGTTFPSPGYVYIDYQREGIFDYGYEGSFKYPLAYQQEDFGVQHYNASVMKYPDNPNRDIAYSLYSERPYSTLVVEKMYSDILRTIPKPPIVFPIEILSYFTSGATIKIKWLAGKAGEHYKHKQLRKTDADDSEIIIQELYRDLSNNYIKYNVKGLTNGFNISLGLSEKMPMVNDEIVNIIEDPVTPGIASINIVVGIGITTVQIYSVDPFISDKTTVSVDIDPLGDWRCHLFPPKGPPETQTGLKYSSTYNLTAAQRFSRKSKTRKKLLMNCDTNFLC
jgi:hypothetical protein